MTHRVFTSPRPHSRRGTDLQTLAWREVWVNAAYPEWDVRLGVYVMKPNPLEVWPPAWFKRSLEIDEYPAMDWYLNNMVQINRAAISVLGRDAPVRVTYPRNFRFRHDPRARRRLPDEVNVIRRARGESLASAAALKLDSFMRAAGVDPANWDMDKLLEAA